MRILAIMSPKADTDSAEIARRAVAEEKEVWALYKAGHLRGMHFQADPVRGLLTFEAPDKAVVEGWLSTFPLVADNLFTFELIAAGPWAPLEALFRDGH